MADFYALGELLIDFTPAGKTPAGIPIFEQNPGGAPANVAVQAARLGVSAGFIGKVGQDMFGTFLRDTLVKQNVDVENLHFSNDTATSLAFVQLSESGDRDFSFYRNPGADTQITFDEVNKDALANAKVLCFGSLLLTAEPGRTAVPQIVSYAREHGAITAYDPNWRAPLWPNAEAGIHAMKSLLPLADVVKASDEELEMLTGCTEIEAGAKEFFKLGVQAAVITRGAKQGNIMEQFLIEAVLICVIGGVLGIVVSYLIGVVFDLLVSNFAMSYSAGSMLLALVCSSAIGIVFGFMPARNASRLNPIDALSRE